jgi:hypothetical protein
MLPNGGKASTSQKEPSGRESRKVPPKEAHALAASQTRELPMAGPPRWRQTDTPIAMATFAPPCYLVTDPPLISLVFWPALSFNLLALSESTHVAGGGHWMRCASRIWKRRHHAENSLVSRGGYQRPARQAGLHHGSL